MSQLDRRSFLHRAAAVAATAATSRCALALPAPRSSPAPLDAKKIGAYLETFRCEEQAATGTLGPDISDWVAASVPAFECSDPLIERVYYFRWYSLHKHIMETGRGRLLSEFLIPVKWAGYGQTIADAAPHHLREVRWLRNDSAAEDYARFWCSPDAKPRNFSFALADSVRAVSLANGNTRLLTELAPGMSENYHAWEAAQQDSNGLFWSIDTRDGMEVSISGDGYRPTINSYMYGDALALAAAARLSGDRNAQPAWTAKAQQLKDIVERELWNPKLAFYGTRSPAPDSGIRAQKKFKDNGTANQLAEVRELIGYVPWYYGLPTDSSRAVGWKQLFDPQGFLGRFGSTTAERRSPRFRFPTNDKCPWNGVDWAFATTQTLVALGNLLNGPAQAHASNADYLRLMQVYAFGHRLTLQSGQVVLWTDEAQDPDTGQWISRNYLRVHNPEQFGRGSYYNHSGFADPLITGLVGLRPREDDLVQIHPLLPARAWSYFAIEGLPYHGRVLRVQYDATGERYHLGSGMRVWIDGKLAASRSTLGPLEARLA